MITKPFVGVLLATASLVSGSALAGDSACVRVSEGWIRFPAMAHMAGGFGRIDNGCKTALTVTSASSEAFGEVSLHETTQADGVSRMREVERLPLAAGKGAELKPGGLHLMLMGSKAALQEGQRVPLVLGLSDGTQVRGEMVVRRP